MSFRVICGGLGLLLFLVVGCTLGQQGRSLKSDGRSFPRVSVEYEGEIRRIEAQLAQEKDPGKLAELHLALARLYVRHDNPGQDYTKARKSLENFISLKPENTPDPEVMDWLAVLERLEKSVREGDELKGCREMLVNAESSVAEERERTEQRRRELADLKAKLDELVKENLMLQEKIEKLKHLDLRLEEKRRSYK